MRHLKPHRMLAAVQWSLAGAGLALALGSLTQISEDGDVPAGVFVGTGIAASSWIPYLTRQDKLHQAIDT